MPHIGKNPAPVASAEYWFSEIPAHGYYGQTASQIWAPLEQHWTRHTELSTS